MPPLFAFFSLLKKKKKLIKYNTWECTFVKNKYNFYGRCCILIYYLFRCYLCILLHGVHILGYIPVCLHYSFMITISAFPSRLLSVLLFSKLVVSE